MWRIGTLQSKLNQMDSITYRSDRELVENKLKAQDTNIKNIIVLLNNKYPNEISYISLEEQLEQNILEQEEKKRKRAEAERADRAAAEETSPPPKKKYGFFSGGYKKQKASSKRITTNRRTNRIK